MDRAVHATSARQGAIGRVDYGIRLLQGDVALVEFQDRLADFDVHK